MNSERNLAVARLIQEHLETCPYSVEEIALLLGCRNTEMVEGFICGDMRVPLDKMLPLSQALGCDKRQLFALVLKSWFGAEFVKMVEEVFIRNSASVTEQDWISFLRDVYGENVPALTPALRRRVRLLVSLPS
jgi:hypothetical protein